MVPSLIPNPPFDYTYRSHKSKRDLSDTVMAVTPFWPMLFSDGSHALECVQQVVELPKSQDLFLPGQSRCNIFKRVPNVAVLALHMSFVQEVG